MQYGLCGGLTPSDVSIGITFQAVNTEKWIDREDLKVKLIRIIRRQNIDRKSKDIQQHMWKELQDNLEHNL